MAERDWLSQSEHKGMRGRDKFCVPVLGPKSDKPYYRDTEQKNRGKQRSVLQRAGQVSVAVARLMIRQFCTKNGRFEVTLWLGPC